MNYLVQLYGDSSKFLRLISALAVFLAVLQAVFAFVFIIVTIITSNYNFSSLVTILTDNRLLNSVFNSLELAIVTSVAPTLVSATFAFGFHFFNLTGNKIIYSFSIIPLLIPDQIFGIAGRMIFDPSIGLLHNIVPKTLLIDRQSALILVANVTLIKWLPVMIVAMDASILGLGKDKLYQIKMDYPNFFDAIERVLIPNMKEIIVIVLSFGFLIGFRQHELAYELTSSGGGFVAETWSYWNYRVMFEFADISRAAVESLLALLVLLVPILIIKNKAQAFTTFE